MSTTFKHVLVVIFLGLLAVAGGAGIMWWSIEAPKASENPFQNIGYASTVSARNLETSTERVNAKNTTTLTFKADASRFQPETFFTGVKEDLLTLDNAELTNVVLYLENMSGTTVSEFGFYPESTDSYQSDAFDKAAELFTNEFERNDTGAKIIVREANGKTKVEYDFTTQWFEWEQVKTNWNRAVTLTESVYNVTNYMSQTQIVLTYHNLVTPDSKNEVGSVIRSMYSSEYAYNLTLDMDFKQLDDVMNQKFTPMHFEEVYWTLNEDRYPTDEQMVFVIAEPANLNEAVDSFLNKRTATHPKNDRRTEYVFRYSFDGDNQAIHPLSLNKQ